MKFLCDNCKAKYQIADDKVAGKTVRMKCRKCGHLIEIRASVTETSVATGVPPEAVVSERPPPASPARPSAPKPSAPSAGAKKPVAPSASTPRPSAAAARPAPSAGTTKPSAGLAPRPAGGGGLASAFSKAVTDEKQPRVEDPSTTRALDMSSPASTEEWYVGINGVPVGPIRVAELRAKAATGAITEDSLVWREGFEEWVPLRTFSELVALLRPDRPSYAPAPTSAARGTSLSNPSQPTSARPASQRPPSRSNVIPFHGRAATAEKLEEAPAASAESAIEDPFAAPRPLAAVPPPAEPPSSGEVAAAPFLVAPAPAIPSELVERPRPAGGIPPAAWFAIVAAMATGVVGGWALFSSKAPPPPTVQIVTVTAPAPTAPAPVASAGSGGDTAEVIEVRPDPSSTVAKTGTGPKVGGAVPTAAAAEKPTAEPATPQVPGIGGVGALPTVGGPSGPSGPGGPSTSGTPDQLSSADIQKVVNNGRNALKRACWEPALAAKSSNAPSSARVQVAITIGRDGRVSRASPSGGDAFPTLGSCIAGRVRNWVFPAANSETQTTAVFNFVAQLADSGGDHVRDASRAALGARPAHRGRGLPRDGGRRRRAPRRAVPRRGRRARVRSAGRRVRARARRARRASLDAVT